MNGSPTHRRYDTLPEPVDLSRAVGTHDPHPVPGPWVGRDTPVDLQQNVELHDVG